MNSWAPHLSEPLVRLWWIVLQRIHVAAFSVTIACSLIGGHQHFEGAHSPNLRVHDDGGRVLLRNVGNQLTDQTMSCSERPQYESPSSWKPPKSRGTCVTSDLPYVKFQSYYCTVKSTTRKNLNTRWSIHPAEQYIRYRIYVFITYI
jgi:hypothetical protein